MQMFLLLLASVFFLFSSPAHGYAEDDPRIQEVLDFWFGPLENAEEYSKEKSARWFRVNPAFDQEIRSQFETLVLAASRNELEEWKGMPRGRLALIILLDQFPRNMYRKTPQAFAFDTQAQQLVLEGLELEEDKKLYPIERTFFYLPLEHAENLKLQILSVAQFTQLLNDVPPSQKEGFQGSLEYAIRHYEIIARFGHFPHRNAILGRPSTPEEIEFLKLPNSSF